MNATIKNAFLGGVVFFVTTSFLYASAAIIGIWTSADSLEANSGSTLSATAWNQLLWNVQELRNSMWPGSVVQIKAVQTRSMWTYSVPVTGNGTAITPLDITITPKKAGNMVILEWNVHGEMDNNIVFTASRNGTLLPDSVNASNNRWSWIATSDYDNNYDSTPNEKVVRIIDFNSLSAASTYQLLVRSAWANAYTYYLNRSIGSVGSDNYETGISTGTATEVVQ